MSGTTGTPRTTSYLLTTEFQDGQPAGSVSPQDMRDFIATVAVLSQGALAPEMYGAVGNGTTNDSAALSACFAAALAAGVPVLLGPKNYALGSTVTITSNVSGTQQGEIPAIIGSGFNADGRGTTLIALAGLTGTMIVYQNVANTVLYNFCIDCNNIAATGLDTTWNVGGINSGPSLNITTNCVQIRNYTSKGWIMDGNNDCPVQNIVMDSPSNVGVTAIQCIAGGGNVIFDNCNIVHTHVVISAQSGQFKNCILHGLVADATSVDNRLSFCGGYFYADDITNINFSFASGGVSKMWSFFGTHIENSNAAGFYFKGPGALAGGATLIGCDLHNVATGGTLVDNTLLNYTSDGHLGRFLLIGNLVYNGISLANATNFTVQLISNYNDSNGAIFSDIFALDTVSGGQTLSANAQTIATSGWSATTLNSSAAFTGLILGVGTVDGQTFVIVNNSGNIQTWNATDATAHVKSASSNTIAAGTSQKYIWNSATSLWWKI